jgi:hypothetical protein
VGSGATAQQVWEYSTRTLTSGGGGDDAATIYAYFTDGTRPNTFKATGFSTLTSGDLATALTNYGAATGGDITNAQTAIINQGNSAWTTATGFLASLGSTAPANWINADSIATNAVTKIQTNLSTFNPTTDSVTVGGYSTGQSPATLVNLSSLATSTNITDARDAVINAGLTAAQVWGHGERLLTGTQATNLAAIALIPTNPLLASSYIAPDNAGIGAIKVKTDQLIFSGGDIVATLAGEEVIVTSASVNAIVAGVNGSLTIPTAVQVRQEIDSNSVELAAIKAAAIAGKNLSAAGL